MTEEKITKVEGPDGETHTTHTTIVSDEPRRGGTSWVVLLVILAVVLVGIWAFSQMGGAEVAKDNAVAEAAGDVGDAAQRAGDAVENVADEVTNQN